MPDFEISISKPDFKFNCAHFVSYKGFRERLHGHNYTLSIKITGDGTLGPDGYLIDFGDVKKVVRELCKSLNEYFIAPMKSLDLIITQKDQQLCLECDDGTKFAFPIGDCALLPLWHSSSEELAHYFWCMIVRRIGLDTLAARNVKSIQVSIAECPAQEAIFRSNIPDSEEELANLEQLLTTNYTVPKGCTATATGAGSGSIGGGPGPQLERQSADSDGMQAPKTDDFF